LVLWYRPSYSRPQSFDGVLGLTQLCDVTWSRCVRSFFKDFALHTARCNGMLNPRKKFFFNKHIIFFLVFSFLKGSCYNKTSKTKHWNTFYISIPQWKYFFFLFHYCNYMISRQTIPTLNSWHLITVWDNDLKYIVFYSENIAFSQRSTINYVILPSFFFY